MKLLCIADVHGDCRALERILADAPPADAILLGGDLTSFGTPDDAEILVRLALSAVQTVLAVAGNCDSAAIQRRLDELGASLNGRGVVVGNVALHGLSAIPPWREGMYQFAEEKLTAVLEKGFAQIADALRRKEGRHVVLSHVPPQGCRLDRTHFFRHVGSRALRAFIERTAPSLAICGHVHEARGVEPLGTTTAVNCGAAAGGFYALLEVGEKLTVELRRA